MVNGVERSVGRSSSKSVPIRLTTRTWPKIQWRVVVWSSGLAERYTMRHCVVLLDLTCASGFASARSALHDGVLKAITTLGAKSRVICCCVK